MAAITGEQFNTMLYSVLKRANMENSAVAYYSFVPVQSQDEFFYNSLYTTGYAFLQNIQEVTVTNGGSGYDAGEVPNVIFTSLDAGTGASGTAVMQEIDDISKLLNQGLVRAFTFNQTGNNLIPSGDFASGETGWSGCSKVTANYEFKDGRLHVYKNVSLTPDIPGNLRIAGPCYFWGSFDLVSGKDYNYLSLATSEVIEGSLPQMPPVYLGTGAAHTDSGTFFFGAQIPDNTEFIPIFKFISGANGGEFIIDNLKCYSGLEVVKDSIANINSEYFTTPIDDHSHSFGLLTGISGAGISDYIYGLSNTSDGHNASVRISQPWWNNYTLSFWLGHAYNPSSWIPDELTLASWPNFQLQIRNGYYGLYIPSTNTYIQSTVQAETGTYPNVNWHNFQIYVQTTYEENAVQPLSTITTLE